MVVNSSGNTFIDINNNGANTGNTFVMGNLSYGVSATTSTLLGITGGNNYKLHFTGGNVSGPGSPTNVNFSVGSGLTLNLGNTFTNGATPVNVGSGTLLLSGNNTFLAPMTLSGTNLGAAPAVNTSLAAFGSFPVTLNNGATLPLTPVLGTLNAAGYTQGGLLARFYSYNAGTGAGTMTGPSNDAMPAGYAVASAGTDFIDANHPAGQGANQAFAQSMAVYSGLLYIQNPGIYTFKTTIDDNCSVTIDNQLLLNAAGTATDYLTTGYHSLVSRNVNNGGQGQFTLVYGGPDTAASGLALQTIPASNLYYPTYPSAGLTLSASQNAAMLSNGVVVAPGALAAIDNQGTELNSVIASLTVSPSSALTINNGTNTGVLGIAGSLTVNSATGSSPVLNVNTGILQTMGGVADNNKGLAKAGQGLLILGPNAPGNFTGGLSIAGGYVQLTDSSSLGTGTTNVLYGSLTQTGTAAAGNVVLPMASVAGVYAGMTVSGSGLNSNAYVVSVDPIGQTVTLSIAATSAVTASTITFGANGALDLNGQTNVTGNLVLSGTGGGVSSRYAQNNGALYNSNQAAASTGAGYTVTLGSSGATISGLGNITLNGIVQDGAVGGTTLTKNGPDTLTLSGNNTFTGPVTVVNGALQLGNSAALGLTSGTNTVTVNAGTTLDLNGQSISTTRPLSLNGTGLTGLAAPNLLGALVNNANGTVATYNGAITLAAAASIGSSSLNPASPGGNIIVNGQIGGAFGLTKVGADVLTLTASEGSTTTPYTVSEGTLALNGNGQLTVGANSSVYDGMILLDNTATNVNSRLSTHGVTFYGGNLLVLGNSAASTTESFSTAGTNFNFQNSASVITIQPTATQPVLLNISSNAALTRNAGATTLIRGAGLGSQAFLAMTGGVAGLGDGIANPGYSQNQDNNSGNNRGVLAWALADTSSTGNGMALVMYDTTNGFQPLSNFNGVNGVTNSLTVTNANVLVTTPMVTTLTTTAYPYVNSLTLNGGGVSIAAGNTVSIISGGLLDLSGSPGAPNTISGPGALWTYNNAELIVHVPNPNTGGTTALTISSPIVSTTGGLTKADGGLLTLAAQNLYTGTTTINGGTLQTAVANAVYVPYSTSATPGNIAATVSGQALQVNLGGTLDLAGNNESFNIFNSAVTTIPGDGGTVMNSGARANFRIAPNANEVFAGSMTGPINFIRDGNNTLTLSWSNNYSGTTTLNGGATTLQDFGTLQGTSEIYIRRAMLKWDDNTGVQALSNRLPTGITMWMDGGAFVFNARAGSNTVQNIGENLVFNSGNSQIEPVANFGTVQLTFSSCSVAPGATVTFGGNVNNVGDSARVYFSNSASLAPIGGILPWATTYGCGNTNVVDTNFATYDPSLGIRPALYATVATFAAGNNVLAATQTLPGGGATCNSLYFQGASTISFTSSADALYVQSGGILTSYNSNVANQIGGAVGQGNLTVGNSGTTGPGTLYLHNPRNTLTIDSNIVDNVPGGSAPLTLVMDSCSQASGTIVLQGSNSYSGATFVNGTIVNLGAPAGALAISGTSLTINGGNNNATDSLAVANASVTLLASNQINLAANVLVNGSAQLNLNNFSNTLANLTINNDGGSNAANGPLVYTGTGKLTLTGSLSVGVGASDGGTTTNATNSFNVPTISGMLAFAPAGGGPGTVNVIPVSSAAGQAGLGLNAVISVAGNAGLNVTGSGVVSIGGQSGNFGPVNVAAGTTLAFGGNGGGNYGAIIGGQVVLPAGATFDTRGNTGTIGSISGSGTITNFTTAAATLYTGLDNTNSTFSGAITNPFAGNLLSVTKIGSGNLNLSGNNSGTGLVSPNLGALTVSSGSVTLNAANAVEGFGAYTLNAGGALTLDNSVAAVNNRLGGPYNLTSPTVATPTTTARALNFQGGNLTILGNLNGNGGAVVSENLGAVNLNATPAGESVLTVSATNTGGVNVVINGAISGETDYGTLLIRGDGLGLSTSAGAAGTATVYVPTAGNIAYPGIVAQGGGADGTTTMSVRTDIIGDASATGSGTGFVTRDPTTGLLRPLNPNAELAGSLFGAAATTNVGLSAPQTLTLAANNANTLTLSGSAAINTNAGASVYPINAGLPMLTLNAGGILVTGGTASINVPFTSGGISALWHVIGAATVLDVNSPLIGTTSGLNKSDAGTLVFNTPQYYSARRARSSTAACCSSTAAITPSWCSPPPPFPRYWPWVSTAARLISTATARRSARCPASTPCRAWGARSPTRRPQW